MMYLFIPSKILVVTVFAFFTNVFCFYFYSYLKISGKKSLIIYPCTVLILVIISKIIVGTFKDFYSFIFNLTIDKANMFKFTIVLFILSCFFISSFVYYFTNIIYRASVVFLIMLIPFFLYFKNSKVIPRIYLIVMITIYFSVMIHCKQVDISKTISVIMDNSYKKSLFVFIAIIAIVATIIPTPNVTPFKDNFLKAFSKASDTIGIEKDFGKISWCSSGKNYNAYLTNDILFKIRASEPLYLRKQVFDIYDGKLWSVYDEDDFSTGYSRWESEKNNNYFLFQSAIKEACEIDENLKEKYNISNEYLNSIKETKKTAMFLGGDYTSSLFLNAINTFEIDSKYDTTYKNENGIIFPENSEKIYSTDTYTIVYFPESYYDDTIYDFCSNLNAEKYSDLLNDATLVLEENNSKEYAYILETYRLEGSKAYAYHYNTDTYLSDEIKNLANQITRGCTSDIEKAFAIQNYFTNNDFKYDLKYMPPEGKENIEYFLLTSKTGTCSDFATAMTLMARAVGLPARYVEGFIADEVDEYGYYTVRETDSHAFPEVYISGIGWMTFEPTVSSQEVTVEKADSSADKKQSFNWYIFKNKYAYIIAISVIVVFTLLFLLRLKILEALFRINLIFKNYNKKIMLLFKHIRKLISKKHNLEEDKLSSKKVKDIVLSYYNIDISLITDNFDKLCYGEKNITKKEFKASYKIYLLYYVAHKL